MLYIYAICNLVNNRKYIGVTCDFDRRIKSHLLLLRKNKHSNTDLQDDFCKYGESNFCYSIIEKFNEYDKDAADLEKYYIQVFSAKESGYNKTCGGEGYGNITYSEAWKNMDDATKKRRCEISGAVLKYLWTTNEFRKLHKKIHSGNKWALGCKCSDELKQKLSKMQKGENNSFFWKKAYRHN